MSQLVGVTSPFTASNTLKKLALFFDRICIHNLESLFATGHDSDSNILNLRAEVGFLIEIGVVFEAPAITPTDLKIRFSKGKLVTSYPGLSPIVIRTKRISGKRETDMADFFDSVKKSRHELDNFMTRMTSVELRQRFEMNSSAVVHGDLHMPTPSSERSDVMTVAIRALPQPDDSVSWEQIVEFRNDPDSKSKFLALKNWMVDISKGGHHPLELSQKLEFLMDEYQRHMSFHKMKIRMGSLETVFVATAEFVEDFTKFRLGKIARDLFRIKHDRIALLEAELKSPGREVAYIVKARKIFS